MPNTYTKYYNYISNGYNYIISLISKKYYIGKFPSFLSIEISSVCNLHCTQCPVGLKSIKKRNKLYLNFDEFTYIVDQIEGKILNLILYFQGEPFLNPNFTEMIKYAHSKRIYTQTSTNSQNIDEQLAQSIVTSGLNHIIISIDGTTQTNYEKYRVGGNLNKCIDAIALINKYKKLHNSTTPKIEAQMIVFKHNENEIQEFTKLSKQWGADTYSIKSAQIYNYKENPSLIPSNKKYSRYIFRNGEWTTKKKLSNSCWRLWNGAVINVDGELLPCCFDKDSKYSYGNVFNDSIYKLWNNEKASNFRISLLNDRSKIDICRNCE